MKSAHRAILNFSSALLVSSCASRSPIVLDTLEPEDLDWGSMEFDAQARLERNGTGTLDLTIELSIRHDGTSAARMDLASARLRVNELPWERCHTPFEFDSDRLLIVLTPQEVTSIDIICQEVPRPQHSLVFRFNGSGMGSDSPHMDIPFSGMRNR